MHPSIHPASGELAPPQGSPGGGVAEFVISGHFYG
jgi:hypothetical protein